MDVQFMYAFTVNKGKMHHSEKSPRTRALFSQWSFVVHKYWQLFGLRRQTIVKTVMNFFTMVGWMNPSRFPLKAGCNAPEPGFARSGRLLEVQG
jgi:hypothetical protein